MAMSRLSLIFALSLAFLQPALALDTLRVGINGNMSWTGQAFGAPIASLPAEYKVSQQLTEVGNAPGNLIDLANLSTVAPRVMVKTVIDSDPGLLPSKRNQTNQILLDLLVGLEGVTRVDTLSQDILSIVLVEFAEGTDLSLVTALVGTAVEPLLPEEEQDTGPVGDGDDNNLECREESQQFESSATVTAEWGDCDSGLVGGVGFTTECFRTICRDRDSGVETQQPGRLQQGKIAAAKSLQEQEGLPEGSTTVVLPVVLSPQNVGRGENVAQRALEWEGRITAPAVTDVSRDALNNVLIELIAPGGLEDAFERKGDKGALGTFIVLDLGSSIGVNRIRFYPRNTVQSAPQYPFQNDFLRQFDLLIHDGQNLVVDGTGRLVPQLQDYQLLLRSTENEDNVVDVPVSPPQLVRFVRLKATSSFPYEIDEIDVFGQGFIATSRYLSPVYDLEGPATWGNISWIERFADLGGIGGEVSGQEDDGCTVNTKLFETATSVTDDWGGCNTTLPNIPGIGYTTRWECYQTVCRDETTGDQIVTPGRSAKLAVSRAAKISADESSNIIVRTRTGIDPTPVLYKRKNVQRVSDDEQSLSLDNPDEQLGRDEYLGLTPNLDLVPPQVWDKGSIEDDLQNWSPWSAPYVGGGQPGGTPVLSPGPRRYIQFAVDFQNSRINATTMLDQLAIEYLRPPIADDLIAEIFPREVDAFESVQFTYAVRVKMDIEGVKGFDTFRISTPTRIEGIDRIQVLEGGEEAAVLTELVLNADVMQDESGLSQIQLEDGSRQTLPYRTVSAAGDTFVVAGINERQFLVQFPQITRPAAGGERLLKVQFRGRVLLYSTLFDGQALLSSQEGSIQRITPGNAASLGDEDLPAASGITVLSPAVTQGSLIGSFVVAPNPFTPNGDGVNDELTMAYDILAVTREVATRVEVMDLSGHLVRTLYRGRDLSGHYDQGTTPGLAWNGRDASGGLVSPGIYLLHIAVEGDARNSDQIRPVAVVY
ncbi:MAG: hypothetical protein GKR89_29145 [Candidatus Latescibacteria bacterium]|nr:hypothetical protein [Candidatus Latescibacterota bacterium]